MDFLSCTFLIATMLCGPPHLTRTSIISLAVRNVGQWQGCSTSTKCLQGFVSSNSYATMNHFLSQIGSKGNDMKSYNNCQNWLYVELYRSKFQYVHTNQFMHQWHEVTFPCHFLLIIFANKKTFLIS